MISGGNIGGQRSSRINDQRRINQIVRGERAISADTALRPSRHFGLSDQCWLNLQSDLQMATEQLQETLDFIAPLTA